jgi:hypothetical protein
MAFMAKATQTAAENIAAGGETILPAPLVTDLTALYANFTAADHAVQLALGNRKAETAESEAALARLTMYLSHVWTAVHHRALREGHPPRIYDYYRMNGNGTHPIMNNRQERLLMAAAVIAGEAEAVAAGYAPIVAPTILELQAVYDDAMAQVGDLPLADKAYDEAQAAIAALRPDADRLIKAARAAITYATYEMDQPSQRRVQRNYGSRYYYDSGEPVDEGDETPVFEMTGVA